ncbi:hypothetical protein J14TS2_16540 [Bacillus sp. J14TS2]|uniref:helix-turn-helix domain-containing protein n=1 Tax=Bacillus sp. J14TS2 TaxID=2807188 RepID=UPI001B1BEB59|nr:helix-turn-helix transcriptional regulator [Bacillus sp. J14TS2]GIN71179.1 hypothetical protein J14TS2_16540 [Bacillus sp. J14TS2]
MEAQDFKFQEMAKHGHILRMTRVVKGLSQESLANMIGLPRAAISKIENNKMELRLSDAWRWGQATQMPEVLAAIVGGFDVATVMQMITTLIGGLIIPWI